MSALSVTALMRMMKVHGVSGRGNLWDDCDGCAGCLYPLGLPWADSISGLVRLVCLSNNCHGNIGTDGGDGLHKEDRC